MARRPTEDDIRKVYRETMDDLYGFVSRRCGGDRELAEDLVQETWLRAVRAWRADGLPERPVAWLCTVAARLLSNHNRRRGTERFQDGVGDTVAAPEPVTEDERTLVERAIARIPAFQARLLQAFHFERRSVAEIASESGLSERAVEGRLRRARQLLRREVERDPLANGDIP